MRIIQSNELSAEQRQQITELEQVCYQKDALENHLFLSNEINYDRTVDVFFLAYEGARLVGFLTIFIPSREEAEISAVVHPAYQRKGIFTRLDEAARQVIAKNQIGRTLYCVETKSESARQVLRRLGISQIARSEYRMELEKSQVTPAGSAAPEEGDLSVKRVTLDRMADFLRISTRAFGEESLEYAHLIATSDTRVGYILYKKEAPVGTFVLGLEATDASFLYGVAVAEAERGKGYGRQLMERACTLGTERGSKLQLDVDSSNPVAFHLYKSMGFHITFQVDYYIR